MTTTMEKVVGCSNRFRIRLMLALPMPFVHAINKRTRRRLKGLTLQRIIMTFTSDLVLSRVDC